MHSNEIVYDIVNERFNYFHWLLDCKQSPFFFIFSEGSARAWSFACLACFTRRTKKKRETARSLTDFWKVLITLSSFIPVSCLVCDFLTGACCISYGVILFIYLFIYLLIVSTAISFHSWSSSCFSQRRTVCTYKFPHWCLLYFVWCHFIN